MKANAVTVVYTVAIFVHRQVLQSHFLQVELQRKSQQDNSTFVPSSTMPLLFVGARMQMDNWVMVLRLIARRL
jgi:hypothetical protein